jgi:hypothetical protein
MNVSDAPFAEKNLHVTAVFDKDANTISHVVRIPIGWLFRPSCRQPPQ